MKVNLLGAGTRIVLSSLALIVSSNVHAYSAPAADTTPPTVVAITFSSPCLGNNTYRMDEQVYVSVQFSEAVLDHGNLGTLIRVAVGSNQRAFGFYDGGGTATWRYAYTISSEDVDSDGLSIAADSLEAFGPFPYIRDTASPANYAPYRTIASNQNAILHAAVPANPSFKVDGSLSRIHVNATANTSRSLTVNWCPLENATSYTLKAYDTSGTTLLRTITGITGTSYVLNPSRFPTIAAGVRYQISITPNGEYASNMESALNLSPLTIVRGREDARTRR